MSAHPGKAVHREFRGIFWGAQFDGLAGHVRAPTGKVTALMQLTIAAVNTGVISVGLLQVLTGSWLAVLHRRRTLCLLDQVYPAIDCHK